MLSSTVKTYLRINAQLTRSSIRIPQERVLGTTIVSPRLSSTTRLAVLSVLSCRAMSTSSVDVAASLPARVESDSFGDLPIAPGKLWGAQTQRSIGNFPIGGPESKSKYISKYSMDSSFRGMLWFFIV